jgi:hypothetical protein
MRRCAGVLVNAERSHYDVSRNGLQRAGLVFAEEGDPAPFVWVDGILSKEDALEHLPFQRSNKIPGMDYICYKSTLFRSLNDMRKQYPHFFDVYPKTYLLPREFLDFQREHKAISGRAMVAPSWVVKPRNGCCGKGISIVQSVSEIQDIEFESVAQLYVNPFLLSGYKFDFRFFLLIGSLEPLTIFVYTEGIARFCTELFEPPSKANRDKKFVHLTNTAINVENSAEPPTQFTKLASEVLQEIAALHPRGATLWDRICEVCRSSIIGIYAPILHNLPKKCDQRPPGSPKKESFFSTRRRDQRPREPLIDLSEPVLPIQTVVPPPRRSIGQPEVVRRHVNMVIVPTRPANAARAVRPLLEPDPIIVGSIVNYQLQPPPLTLPGPIPLLAGRRRSCSLSPDRFRPAQKPLGLGLPPIPPEEEEADLEAVDQKAEIDPEDAKPQPPPLKLAKRYFHILGIDVLIDADLNPKVLELNDRPSLGVTVPFEEDLKESIIADAFEHVCPNGEVKGDSPETSRWRQIFPQKEGGAHWREIVKRILNPQLPPMEQVKTPPTQTTRSQLEYKQTHKEKKKRKSKKGTHPDTSSG